MVLVLSINDSIWFLLLFHVAPESRLYRLKDRFLALNLYHFFCLLFKTTSFTRQFVLHDDELWLLDIHAAEDNLRLIDFEGTIVLHHIKRVILTLCIDDGV